MSWKSRTALAGNDGSHDAIDLALRIQGFVDLEVVANVDGLELDFRPDASVALNGPASAMRAGLSRLSVLLQSANDTEVTDRTAALGNIAARLAGSPSSTSPMVTMRVTREGLLKLADSDDLRAMRPIGFVDQRKLDFDAEAEIAASKYGQADVMIVLRDAYTGGRLSPASMDGLKRSNRSALNAILATVSPSAIRQDFSRFGSVSARLNAGELAKLAQTKDPRLLAVVLNKPVATAQLATSGPTMNMQSAYNAGYVGNGQGVIILDTGVEATHPFYGGRVVFQACFGTTGPADGENWVTLCPGGNASNNWDSPLGTPDAAKPPPFSDHGTHVAGIAAGNRTQPSVMRGTAPGSNIYAVQVFSTQQFGSGLKVFNDDMLAALQLAAQSLPTLTGGQQQPYSLNMSLGGSFHLQPCTIGAFTPFINAVQQLRTAGVPVVVATGNNGYTGGINFPACIQGAIKVSSVANDGIGNTRSQFLGTDAANVVDPSAFPSETFWLAPGGGSGTQVISSVKGGGYSGNSGTSMAAPQIAGLYASAKSAVTTWTVDQITAYFNGQASVAVPITVSGAPTPQVNWRRIQLPNF